MEMIPSLKYKLTEVQKNRHVLNNMTEQTLEICLEIVKRDSFDLQFVKKPVKQNGFALEYVNYQTPELCLVAVRQNGFALEDVKEQTTEICQEAVKKAPQCYNYVKIELPIDFLLEKFYHTDDKQFKKWIESQPNWIQYHKQQLMNLLEE